MQNGPRRWSHSTPEHHNYDKREFSLLEDACTKVTSSYLYVASKVETKLEKKVVPLHLWFEPLGSRTPCSH